MISFNRFMYSVMLMIFITACTTITAPQSLDQRLAYAYGVHSSALTVAADLVKSGTITKQDGKQVLIICDNARQALDAAKSAQLSLDTTTAESKLSLATNVLRSIQNYLLEYKK